MTTTAQASSKHTRQARPWGDYLLRGLACILLFGSGFSLLATSTFALRMRDDVPPLVPGLAGVEGLAVIIAAVLAFIPLLMGRRFLGAFLVSAFLLSGIGAYWWTLIPWDELITESDFVTQTSPDWWRYFQVATPLVAAVLYVVASRSSRMRAEYRNRGADPSEISHAAASSFLAGMGVLVVTLAFTGGLWQLLATGALLAPPPWVPRGIPALVMAAALVALAWALMSKRVGLDGTPAWVTRPWTAAAGLAARARSRGRKSPS